MAKRKQNVTKKVTMARSKTTSRSPRPKVSNFSQPTHWPRSYVIIAALLVALVGTWLVFRSFAATTTLAFSGNLSPKHTLAAQTVTVTANGTLSANLSYGAKLSGISFKLLGTAGQVLATGTGSNPSTLSATVSPANYTLSVSSTRGSGAYSLAVVLPIPDPSAGDTTPPSAPTNLVAGATSTSQVDLSWSASNDNVGVSTYDVYRNGVLVTSTVTTGYSDTNLTPATSYSYSVKARDASGNVSAGSNVASATTQAPADTTLPTVTIGNPAPGSSLNGVVSVTGTAGDNVSVAKVELQVDSNGFVAATGTTSWNYSLNTALYTDGLHTLTARATDGAGNQAVIQESVKVQNASSTQGGSPPTTAGTWVSPEGLTITVNSAGTDVATGQPWTIAGIYNRLKTTSGALDLAQLGSTLTINVQDQYSSQTQTSTTYYLGKYTGVKSTMWLQGLGSNFVLHPDEVLAHEYGHAWSNYLYYTAHQVTWGDYLSTRWTTSDGSMTLATDSRTGTSYSWTVREIIADDYRLLFGVGPAISGRNGSLNQSIPDPRNQPGLKDFLYNTWRSP